MTGTGKYEQLLERCRQALTGPSGQREVPQPHLARGPPDVRIP